MAQTNFIDEVRSIQNKAIRLPDFQREFVWDVEKQRHLIASVLTKLPVGSILLLEAREKDYSCKELGKKDKIVVDENSDNKKIFALIDGQQRMTALTNIFSNIIFDGCEDESPLANPYLLNKRFFIKIEPYENLILDPQKDYFGLTSLSFPNLESQDDHIDALTSDILEQIYCEEFQYSNKSYCFSPFTKEPNEMSRHCVRDDGYYIPLFLLIDTDKNKAINKKIMNDIYSTIIDDVIKKISNTIFELENTDEVEAEIKSRFEDIYYDDYLEKTRDFGIFSMEDTRFLNSFRSVLKEQALNNWKERLNKYLVSCLENMELGKIVVQEANRERAIDIYENLNLGGVTLSTFDLILARAATKRSDNEKNLSEELKDYINNTTHETDRYLDTLVPSSLRTRYEEFKQKEPFYSASNRIKCCSNSKFNGKYIEALLDVLCMICNNPEYKPDKVTTDDCKKKRQLDLSATAINLFFRKAYVGMDRACFFLQVRCGIRKIEEVKNNLLLVIIAYLFTNDNYFFDVVNHEKIEAWYWSAIFSGEFNVDQNMHYKSNLTNFLSSHNKERVEYLWIGNMSKEVFNRGDFSDQHILLLEDHKRPKDIIRTSICQYYLSRTYKDFNFSNIEEKKIHIFMDDVEKLEEHHVVPLGSLVDNVGQKTEDFRRKKDSILNSPLNFIYITPEANKQIGCMSIRDYLSACKANVQVMLGVESTDKTETEEDIRTIMKRRFVKISEEIKKTISDQI